jgi:signal transduction histidine kinase
LKTISQSVAKINTMSSRLALLNRKIELTLKETDLNTLIKSAVSDAQRFVKSDIVQDLDAQLPSMPIDQEQMYKVLENLLMNAYDASGPQGQIAVSSRMSNHWAVMTVSDNGCGMSRAFMEKRLFRPFQTTKKQGMGIGLYHCKTIIDAHGGKLNVESEEGKGTTFEIWLPIKKSEED